MPDKVYLITNINKDTYTTIQLLYKTSTTYKLNQKTKSYDMLINDFLPAQASLINDSLYQISPISAQCHKKLISININYDNKTLTEPNISDFYLSNKNIYNYLLNCYICSLKYKPSSNINLIKVNLTLQLPYRNKIKEFAYLYENFALQINPNSQCCLCLQKQSQRHIFQNCPFFNSLGSNVLCEYITNFAKYKIYQKFAHSTNFPPTNKINNIISQLFQLFINNENQRKFTTF